jgi:quinol monooxygenase YgiN
MKFIKYYLISPSLIFFFTSVFNLSVSAQNKNRIIRMARLQIDSVQLDAYKAILKEQIEAAVRLEPGVLMLYAVAEKDHPTSITVFEIYASTEAYQSHIKTSHFLKYKNGTKDMVKSLQLIDADPIALEAKKTLPKN